MTPLQQLKATNLRKAENLEALIRADPTIAGSQLARIVGYIGLYRRFAHELGELMPEGLPVFLYEYRGHIRMGRHGDADVTVEWNDYLNGKTT
jgi:hypothetical protein